MAELPHSLNGRHLPPDDDGEGKVLGKALHERFDKINKLWQDAEQKLRQYPVPFDVDVAVDHYEDWDASARLVEYLGFVKTGQGWRICYTCLDENYPADELGMNWKPILEAPADVRKKGFAYFPKLFTKVKEEVRKYIGELDDSISKFDAEIRL